MLTVMLGEDLDVVTWDPKTQTHRCGQLSDPPMWAAVGPCHASVRLYVQVKACRLGLRLDRVRVKVKGSGLRLRAQGSG